MPAEEPLPPTRSLRWDDGIDRFILAVHTGRIVIAAMALYVAVRTRENVPVEPPFGVFITVLALAWVIGVATSWPRLRPLLERHPGLIWVDTVVIVSLSLLDKPWDSLVALPYTAFAMLVPYVRPIQLFVAVLVISFVGYLPKIVVTAVGWEYADLATPSTPVAWATLYVGPLATGLVGTALCLLVQGIRSETAEWIAAEAERTALEAQRARAQSRRAIASRLHETVSQAVRAVVLRLSADGASPQTEARREAVQIAKRLRRELARLTGGLADAPDRPEHDGGTSG